jgi:transketolase
MDVWRPADSTETTVAWVAAAERHNGPTSLVLSRQNVLASNMTASHLELIRKGGYVFSDWLVKRISSSLLTALNLI